MRSPSQKILISRGLYLKMFSSQGVPITRGHHHQRSTSHEFPTTRGSHHPKRSLSQIVPNTRGPIQSEYIFRNFVFIVQTYCIRDRVQSTYIQVYPRPNISGLPVAFHWSSKAWILDMYLLAPPPTHHPAIVLYLILQYNHCLLW